MSHGNPEPWFRNGRGWFVTLSGKQVNLRTKDKSEAYAKWHKLMAERGLEPSLAGELMAVDLLAMFCEWAEKHLAPRSYQWYRNYLKSLVERLPGDLKAAALKPYFITQWLDANPDWGQSSRRGAITAAKRAFSWAEQQGLIKRSPIAHVKRPPASRRSTTLSPEQRKLIFDSASDQQFRDLLIAAELTGARPQELCQVEARHFDSTKGIWLFPVDEHKTGEKTGRPRIVYLPAPVQQLCKRLVKTYAEGILFRNSIGCPWNANTIRLRFKRLRKRYVDQLPNDLCLYHYRHTFATDALENGVNPVTVAELLGHADAAMLTRVYQHVADRHDHMREAVERATGKMFRHQMRPRDLWQLHFNGRWFGTQRAATPLFPGLPLSVGNSNRSSGPKAMGN